MYYVSTDGLNEETGGKSGKGKVANLGNLFQTI